MRVLVFVFLGLGLLATGLNGLPSGIDKDESASHEEGSVVYVIDVHAIRNVKSADVGKMLDEGGIESIKSTAEPVGILVLADEESDVPITLGEFSEIVQDLGMTVEKLNEGDELKIIEIKFDDMSMEDFDDFMSFEELIRVLKAEGILLELTEEHAVRYMQVSFDERLKNPEDQPFSLEELAEFFEKDGYHVNMISTDGAITAIRIRIDEIPEEEITKRPVAKKDEKKTDRNDKKDDRFSTLDYITKSDSLNKIRRRRSTCSECKTGSLIKNIIEKSKEGQ